MYRYLIIYPDRYEIHQSEMIYHQKQVVEINGSNYISELYHLDDNGPYGVLIRQFDPVNHPRIREVIRQADIPALPQP